MPEYITKEQAIDAAWDAFTSHDDPDLGRVIEENIERLPAADVAPVVHARWERFHLTDAETEPGTGFINIFVLACSRCGKYVADKTNYKYCPQCGARMDGEDHG